MQDLAPLPATDPSVTIEFYATVFITIGASLGATVFGRILGTLHTPRLLLWRAATLAVYSALLAAVVTFYVDIVLQGLVGHGWAVFGALWLYALAIGAAVTGAAAAAGTIASVVVTLFLVIIGNASAGGPVGRALLPGFFSTFTAVVPQGSGLSLLRGIQYFGGDHVQTSVLTLVAWATAGLAFAVVATLARRAESHARARTEPVVARAGARQRLDPERRHPDIVPDEWTPIRRSAWSVD